MTARAMIGTSLGRYLLFDELASGGMAVIHLGILAGDVGFARIVAIKRLHAQFARDPEFVGMFTDEAKLASRIRHMNVVAPVDVVASDGELFLVMDYVLGEALSGLVRASRRVGVRIPPKIAVRIAIDALLGLHAAHEASDEDGALLHIIHRDVSPDNVMVGADGVARVLDFGIAKASVRVQTTRAGQLKGKLRYMSPEQLKDQALTPRADVYAAAVVLWEALTGQRLHAAQSEAAIVTKVLYQPTEAPGSLVDDVPPELDQVVLRGVAKEASDRFASAQEMAIALEQALPPAPHREVQAWMRGLMGDELERRAERVRAIERSVMAQSATLAQSATAAKSPGVARMATPATQVAGGPMMRPDAASAPALPRSTEVQTATLDVDLVELASQTTPPNRRASLRRLALAGLIAFVLIGASVVVLKVRQPSLGAAHTSSSAEQASAAVANVPEQNRSSLHVDAAQSTLPPSSAGDAGGPVSPSAVPSASAMGVLARPPVRSHTTPIKPKPKPAPNCNPPWVEDAKGFRQVKRECL